MYIIPFILLSLPAVLSNYQTFTPCDCFDISLEHGYPRADYGGICYKYNINKKWSNYDCPAELDYYIIGSGSSYECPVRLADIAETITWSTNDECVIAPYRGKHDGTKVNGIKIGHSAQLSTFTICFDPKKVDGVQSQGTIGLVDTNGNADRCTIDNILPNFCVTDTPHPTTPAPIRANPTTAAPTTNQPTAADPTTASPTTSAPTTSNPTTSNPTTSSPTTENPTTSAPTTSDPTTANPTTAAPTTSDPTTADPTTASPTTTNPTTSNPTTSDPTTAGPTTANPTTAAPTTSDPTTAEPTTSNPTSSQPTTANPTTFSPTTANPTTSDPTTAEPTMSPTCISNAEDRAFSCECFDNDPDPDINCPRDQCVYDYPAGQGRGCENIPVGTGGNNGTDPEPIQCNVDNPECAAGAECIADSVCGGGPRFGCCKAPPAIKSSSKRSESNSKGSWKKSWSKSSKSKSSKTSKGSNSKESGWKTYTKSVSKGSTSKASKSSKSSKGSALLKSYNKSTSKVSAKKTKSSKSSKKSGSKSDSKSGSGSKSSSGDKDDAKSVILPFDEGMVSEDITGDGKDKFHGYMVIIVVTLLFNVMAYFLTYMCCIRRMVKNTDNKTHLTKSGYSFANKDLEDSDAEVLRHDF